MSSPAAAAAPAAPAAGAGFSKAAFATALAKLKYTDKQTITVLTELARQQCAYAGDVVKVLVGRLKQLPRDDHRLPLLYLIDSICQNLGKKGIPYPKLMQQHLEEMFADTVPGCSVKVRSVEQLLESRARRIQIVPWLFAFFLAHAFPAVSLSFSLSLSLLRPLGAFVFSFVEVLCIVCMQPGVRIMFSILPLLMRSRESSKLI